MNDIQLLGLTPKALWELAYNQLVLIDYTGQDSAVLKTTLHWVDLYNYRTRVRKFKLNPLYILEWHRIERTKITRVSPSSFLLTRKYPHLIDRISSRAEGKLPLVKLDVPISTTNKSIAWNV